MIKKDLIITLNNEKFFILDTLEYNNTCYGFSNKIDENDESLNVYKIIFEDNGKINVLEDENLCNILLPLFEERITRELKRMMEAGEI